MSVGKLYIGIGAIIVVGVALLLILSPSGQEERPSQASFPPGHPDVGAAQSNDPAAAGQPSKANVRQDFVHELEMLKKKIDAAPASDTSGVLRLAQMMSESHQAAAAIPYFDRYLKAAPKNTTAMLDLSVALYNSGKTDKALETTQRILKIDPKNTTALYNLGALYAGMDKAGEAKKAWQSLIDRYPDSEDAQRAKEALARLK